MTASVAQLARRGTRTTDTARVTVRVGNILTTRINGATGAQDGATRQIRLLLIGVDGQVDSVVATADTDQRHVVTQRVPARVVGQCVVELNRRPVIVSVRRLLVRVVPHEVTLHWRVNGASRQVAQRDQYDDQRDAQRAYTKIAFLYQVVTSFIIFISMGPLLVAGRNSERSRI